jgi:hypothetical protein
MMSHQPLIGGYGRLRPGLPQYAQVQQQSHESNNSDQSIQTQVPTPFHQTPGLQTNGFSGHFGLNENGNGLQTSYVSNGFNSMALNPTSASYVPTEAGTGSLYIGSFAAPGGAQNRYAGVIGQGQLAGYGQNGGEYQMGGYANTNQYASSDVGGASGPYSHFRPGFVGSGYGNGSGVGMPQQYQMSSAPSPTIR